MQDFDGRELVTTDGTTVGTIERTYDDEGGTARFVEVTTGPFFARKHRLVPMDGAEVIDDSVRVPLTKATIEGSPDASSGGETLAGDLLDQVRAYYGGAAGVEGTGTRSTVPPDNDRGAVPVGDADDAAERSESTGEDLPRPGEIRDLGDVIEIPIVEEELVKRPVVREVLRVRKQAVPTTESVAADIRREDVEVVPSDDTIVHDDETDDTET